MSSDPLAQNPVSKKISNDKTFIDYTRDNAGVRVWSASCQALIRQGPAEEWQERGERQQIPLAESFSDVPYGKTMEPMPAPAFEVLALGSDELRRLVKGQLPFDAAIERG